MWTSVLRFSMHAVLRVLRFGAEGSRGLDPAHNISQHRPILHSSEEVIQGTAEETVPFAVTKGGDCVTTWVAKPVMGSRNYVRQDTRL